MNRTKIAILDALRLLTAKTAEPASDVFGPSEIAETVRELIPGSKAGTSLISAHLKSLVESEQVERVPLGAKRGAYRLARPQTFSSASDREETQCVEYDDAVTEDDEPFLLENDEEAE